MSRPRPIRDARGRFVRRASAPQQGEAIAAPSSAWTIHAVGLEAVDPTPALRCEILPLARPTCEPRRALHRAAASTLALAAMLAPILAYGWWRGIL